MIHLSPHIEFTVPGNPVPAQRARVMRGGWSFTPKRTADAEALVAECYRSKASGCWFVGPIYMTCWFYLGDKRRKDLDNLAKTVLDGLTKGRAWEDDSQVKALELYAYYDKENPRTVVSIETLESKTWGSGALVPAPPVAVKPKKGAKR